MSIRRVVEALGAGVAVYALVVACSSHGAVQATGGGLFDAVSNSTPEAKAGSPPASVATAPCEIEVDAGNTQVLLYAEMLYQGKSVAELSAVRAVVTNPHYGTVPQGYQSVSATTFLRDGAVAVRCGAKGAPAESVTFILPSGVERETVAGIIATRQSVSAHRTTNLPPNSDGERGWTHRGGDIIRASPCALPDAISSQPRRGLARA